MAKRKDNRYVSRYKDHYFYGKTKAEAEKKRNDFRYRCEHEIGEIRQITVRKYSEEWLTTYKSGVQKGTYNQYRCLLDKLNAVIGDYYVSAVTPDDAARVWKTFVGVSKSQINKAGIVFRGLFDAARESGYSHSNPFRSLVVRPPKGSSGTHRAITDADL